MVYLKRGLLCCALLSQLLSATPLNITLVTRRIQTLEENLNEFYKNLEKSYREEKLIQEKVSNVQFDLVQIILKLRHLKEVSPLLSALSLKTHQDFVHTMILLETVIPGIAKKHQNVLSSFHDLIEVRQKIVEAQTQINTIRTEILSEREQQIKILEKNQDQISLSSIPKELKEIQVSMSTEEAVTRVIRAWDSLNIVMREHYTFTIPVVGDLQKGCVGYICPKDEHAQFHIVIRTKPEAQVIAPCDVLVAFIGFVQNDQHIVVLKHNDTYFVLEGLEHISCQIGQHLNAGSPIGRMPQTQAPRDHLLRLHVRKGDSLLDPFYFFHF